MNDVIITDISMSNMSIVISYSGSEQIEAWLENKNKHYPHILHIDVDNKNHNIIIEYQALCRFIEHFPGHVFKLSLCTISKWVIYKVSNQIKDLCINNTIVAVEDNAIYFCGNKHINKSRFEDRFSLDIHHKNKPMFENIEQLPVDILNIGSCFSRSIFRSDEYFNPMYKKYFCIKYTLFHNSFISLFSDKITYNYSIIEDLITGDAGKYVGVEFRKDIRNIVTANGLQLVVVDNYIDASTPIIRFDNDAYLTYNKYLSESIFKRFFSSCEIIYPGSKKHLELYRKSIIAFHTLVNEYNIKNIVLIGGRLSKYKIDDEILQTYLWDDKMEWILNVNRNWDEVDQLFLREIPSAIYIDKRNTSWKSDVHSPIIGGASPSHYQSGYYKELFEDLLQFISEDLVYEK